MMRGHPFTPPLTLFRGLFALLFVLLSGSAQAHELSIAEMELRQLTTTDFLWQWSASGKVPPNEQLTPKWPEGCSAEGQLLRCGKDGLRGKLTIEGVGKSYSAVLVKLYWLEAPLKVYTISSAQKTARIGGVGQSDADDIVSYIYLGVEHILLGIDHLLFVLGLLFLVGNWKQLVGTVTAFTIAHSITLAGATLGWVYAPQAPIEATIALSVMFVAAEILRRADGHRSLTATAPWLVAFVFGLLHGFGFSGALREVGLPEQDIPLALLFFNVGVEVGQLAFIAVVVVVLSAVTRVLRKPGHAERGPWQAEAMIRVPVAYVIGSVAAFWTVQRVVGFWG